MQEMLNKIVLGDCMDIMRGMPDKSVDMILCDLPYGTTACKWDTIIPFDKLWEQYNRIIKDNGAIVLTASQPFTSALIMSNIKMFKYEWIWIKERPTNPLLCKKQPPKYHESILVFYKGQPIFNPSYIDRLPKNKRNNKPSPYSDKTKINTNMYSDRVLSGMGDKIYHPNILNVSMERGLHPTQKPIALMEYFIKTYTNENEIVLDNCIGSGTTAIAAIRTGRQFIGIEKDPEYHRLATERVEKEKLNLFNTGG